MTRYEYFRLFHDLSQADYDLLTAELQTKACKKNELLVVPGQTQRELYFVKSGIQMSYYATEKIPDVIAFTYAPNICAIPESFSFQTPSKCFLTCLTDSELDYISYEALQKLFDQSQQIERLFRKMTEAVLAGIINRHHELQALTIEERYRAFCSRSAHLLHLVNHKYIASYLSISPTNFSKLFNTVKF